MRLLLVLLSQAVTPAAPAAEAAAATVPAQDVQSSAAAPPPAAPAAAMAAADPAVAAAALNASAVAAATSIIQQVAALLPGGCKVGACRKCTLLYCTCTVLCRSVLHIAVRCDTVLFRCRNRGLGHRRELQGLGLKGLQYSAVHCSTVLGIRDRPPTSALASKLGALKMYYLSPPLPPHVCCTGRCMPILLTDYTSHSFTLATPWTPDQTLCTPIPAAAPAHNTTSAAAAVVKTTATAAAAAARWSSLQS